MAQPLPVPDLFAHLGLAVAIGFLIGVERGWKQRYRQEQSRVAGLRTYTLIGLLGGISALLAGALGPVTFAAFAIVFGLAWSAFKLYETANDQDLSITGLVAGLLVYALGAYSVLGDMQIAAAAAVVAVLVLAFKDATHAWVERLTWPEISSALAILAATLVALPLLPNHALDPYGAFNPRLLWLLTIAIAGASFVGYVALRVLGPTLGLYVGAAVGAIVSSTAVTLDVARRCRAHEADPLHAAAAATLASIVMFLRVAILTSLFATPALFQTAPALLIASTVSALFTIVFAIGARRARVQHRLAEANNPLDLIAIGRFAIILAAITMVAHLFVRVFGESSLLLFATGAGLVDVDAVALAIGGLVQSHSSTSATAAAAILLATAMDTVSKSVIAIAVGPARFSRLYLLASLCALAAGVAAFVFIGPSGLSLSL